MAFSKYKRFYGKKLNSKLVMAASSLRKENARLKKTLDELSRQHSERNKLVEKFLSLETSRLESCQQQTAKDEIALPSEQPSKKEEKQIDVVSMRRNRNVSDYSAEIEDIKKKLVSVSDSTSDECASTKVTELQNQLSDALEKNKRWLEYDQQREAYVRAILARMLWLEKQLNEANQALSQQHNEDHSDEKERISQMQEHYERLLQRAKDELEVLRVQVDMTHKNLIMTQQWCEERQDEVEELKQQLQTEKVSRKGAEEDHDGSEDEKQQLRDETKDLQRRLDEEKRRSASFELQVNLCQKVMLNHHHADQEKIKDLEQQIKISSQDLEDEKQDCSYLKQQMLKLLKTLKKSDDCVTKQSKTEQQDRTSCEAAHPSSRESLTSSPHSSLMDESLLECPSCLTQYPASRYRELINHIEICLD